MLRRAALALIVLFSAVSLPAQLRVRPVADETGEVALQLMFRKLRATATFMMTTAHPDDENSGLLAQMAYGQGLRTVLVTATRGDGGQNEIGPEIFDALAVLRTEELMAVHRFDGAEQLFTRAVDFGYSFSVDETYDKWGRDAIIGDYVHQIRATRPDVVVGFIWEGTGGGLHHQASTRLTAEAFRAAADPARYPEQIKAGLRPWQAKKFYYTGAFGGPAANGPGDMQVNSAVYDAVLGRTYDELGAEARTMHKCQGTSQLSSLPGPFASGRSYHLQDSTLPPPSAKEASMLEGIDSTLAGLAAYAGPQRPAALTAALRTIAQDVDSAEAGFHAKGLGGAIQGLSPAALKSIFDSPKRNGSFRTRS
jgi:LmbE family N-acetylglucosaminyl deacetylase